MLINVNFTSETSPAARRDGNGKADSPARARHIGKAGSLARARDFERAGSPAKALGFGKAGSLARAVNIEKAALSPGQFTGESEFPFCVTALAGTPLPLRFFLHSRFKAPLFRQNGMVVGLSSRQ